MTSSIRWPAPPIPSVPPSRATSRISTRSRRSTSTRSGSRLKNQVPSLLGLLINYQGGNMVCKKAAEEMGEKFTQKPIGTGPFMFGEYKSKESVTLVANPQYFRGKPKLEKIVYRYILSDASRDLAFTSGEIDLDLRQAGPDLGRPDEEGEGHDRRRLRPGRAVGALSQRRQAAAQRSARAAGDRLCDRPQSDRAVQGQGHRAPRAVDRSHRLSRAERRRAAAALRSREGEGAAQGSRLSERPHHQDHPHQPARACCR